MSNRGKFIVFEGIDGSGKTTQSKRLADLIGQKDKSYWTSECSTGPIGRVIREEFLSGKRKSDPRITNLLYAVDRLDHITNDIQGMLKYLEKGFHVICDRYYMSSMAYYALDFYDRPYEEYVESMQFIYKQNQMNKELLTPDVTFFIDVPIQTALNRINMTREANQLEIYETPEKLQKCQTTYGDAIDVLRSDGELIINIDGSGDEDDVHKQIVHNLKTVFPDWKVF